MADPNAPPFKSLFLPLGPKDCAVYAAVCPLLTLSLPTATADTPPSPTTARSTAATFSPTEGNVMDDIDDDIHHGADEVLARHKSALFALLSSRADGAVAVLKNRDVVFFSLSHPTKGPVEVSRFSPLPTTKEVQAAASSSWSEATCASLIPMELAFLCRLDSKQPARGSSQASSPVYMRGLVGCKDGRVSLFSETSYVSGFAAHDCPVTAVQAIYAYDKDSSTGAADGASPPSSPTGGQAAAGGFLGVRSLSKATQHLGFVTAGKNGTVYVWRQHSDRDVKPKPLSGATSARRTVALCVYQPPSTAWFLSSLTTEPQRTRGSGGAGGSNSNSNGKAACPADTATLPEIAMPCPMALYALPGVRRCVRSQLLSPRAMAKEAAQPLLETITTGDVHDYVLPNLGLYTTTVIATNGEICVLSYSNKLQAFPLGYMKPLDEPGENQLDSLATRVKAPVFVAKKAITHVVLSGGLCVVACGKHGLVYVLQIPSFSCLGEFYTYQCRPVASITVYPSARLVTVVDAVCGSVELVQVQQSAFASVRATLTRVLAGSALVKETYASLPAAATALPTSVALRYQCELEAITADIAKKKGQAALAEDIISRQDELRACQEALLLSSMGIPPACETYMHRDSFVL